MLGLLLALLPQCTAAATSSPVHAAVLTVLCEATTTYERVQEYPGRGGVGGLFSQLNFLAQEVLLRTLKGQRPVADFHSRTILKGYGSAPLASHFHAIPCGRGQRRVESESGVAPPPATPTVEEALATLRSASRYLLVSHLLSVLYRPRAAKDLEALMPAAARPPSSVDLAIHVRRGDKFTEARPGEKIKLWDAASILEEVPKHVRPNGTVLIASDDDAFTLEVTERLASSGYFGLRHGNEQQKFDEQNRSIEAALVCDTSCVPPLLALKQSFSHARTLMVSTKSNLGSHLLSSWAASNADAAPGLIDLDNVVSAEAIKTRPGGKYFCELPWGSRRGLCRSSEATCDLPHMQGRSFCKGDAKSSGSGAGGSGRRAASGGGGRL